MRSAFAAFLRGFTLPFGATTGRRIVLDGENGSITWYRADNTPGVIIGGPNPTFDDQIKFPSGDANESFAGNIGSLIDGAGGTRRLGVLIQSGAMNPGTRYSAIELLSGSADATLRPVIHLYGIGTGLTLRVSSGLNDPVGEATLVAGTVAVACDTVTADSVILLSRRTIGAGVIGNLTYTRTAGVGFTINSDQVTDDGVIGYLVIDPAP